VTEKQFMALGDPKEKFFLRWTGYDSFFDDKVQAILNELHPSKQKYPDGASKAYPIKAWFRVDVFARSRDASHWQEIFPFIERQLIFTTELLAAVVRWREIEHERFEQPQTALDELKKWRLTRYVSEHPIYPITHAAAVKAKTLLKRWSFPSLESPPLPVHETPKPPTDKTGRMDGKGKLSQVAYRKAAYVENERRDKIMLHWADCWDAYLENRF
jgi:hypothetical protein